MQGTTRRRQGTLYSGIAKAPRAMGSRGGVSTVFAPGTAILALKTLLLPGTKHRITSDQACFRLLDQPQNLLGISVAGP